MINVDVRLQALGSPMHSGMFGGPAPDPVAALVAILASLRDADGNTTIDGLDNTQRWSGVTYPAQQFRVDANVLDGVSLVGSGSVADMLWTRPAVTVLGIDIPPVVGSAGAIQASVAARISLRIPPGMHGAAAHDALITHLRKRVPWNLRCDIDRVALRDPFVGPLGGPGSTRCRFPWRKRSVNRSNAPDRAAPSRCATCSPRRSRTPRSSSWA